jgi:hypothetical protein
MIDHVQQKIVFLLCRFVVMPSYEINSTTLLRVGEWENPREHNQTRARGVSPGGEAGRIGYPRREAIVGLVCVTMAYRASHREVEASLCLLPRVLTPSKR